MFVYRIEWYPSLSNLNDFYDLRVLPPTKNHYFSIFIYPNFWYIYLLFFLKLIHLILLSISVNTNLIIIINNNFFMTLYASLIQVRVRIKHTNDIKKCRSIVKTKKWMSLPEKRVSSVMNILIHYLMGNRCTCSFQYYIFYYYFFALFTRNINWKMCRHNFFALGTFTIGKLKSENSVNQFVVKHQPVHVN